MTCPQCEKLRTTILGIRATFRLIRAWTESDNVRNLAKAGEDECTDMLAAAPSPLTTVIEWIPVSERLPEDLYAGDRVLVASVERARADAPFERRIVILEATETGWHCADPGYPGYTPEDGEYWIREQHLLLPMPPLPQPPASEA